MNKRPMMNSEVSDSDADAYMEWLNEGLWVLTDEGECLTCIMDVEGETTEEEFKEGMSKELFAREFEIWCDLTGEGAKVTDRDWQVVECVDYTTLAEYVQEVKRYIADNCS